jgi:hydrogenase/urease accessory protein HupE
MRLIVLMPARNMLVSIIRCKLLEQDQEINRIVQQPLSSFGERGFLLFKRLHMRSIIAFFIFFFSSLSFAHAPFQVNGTLSLKNEKNILNLLLTNDTASKLCLLHLPYGSVLNPEELKKSNNEILACITKVYRLKDGVNELTPEITQVVLIDDNDLTAVLEYPATKQGTLSIEATHLTSIEGMFINSSSFIVNKGAEVLANKLFSQTDFLLDLSLPKETPLASFMAYFHLGVEHIFIGFDHLLFLAGLLLACRRWRTTALIITSFTLAHSITLAIAALGWVSLDSRWVEISIAASIVLVGLDNLWRSDETHEPRARWLITFVFGLIHGFGFASVLSESGLASGPQLIISLVGFNLGVEVGQLLIASVFLVLLFQLLKINLFRRWGTKLLSLGVIAGGMYWLIERI